MQTNGIHHVTAIAADPQENVDFYTDVLGLRLVKKTVNFDDKFTYHLYYGNRIGEPGTIMTFFPFEGGYRGQRGRGQVTTTQFVIPDNAVDYWVDRLETEGVGVDAPEDRFDGTVVAFRDHDGQPLELVTGRTDIEPWKDGPVPAEYAIRGFHGVTVNSANPDATATVLESLGYEHAQSTDDRTQYVTSGDRASTVDVLQQNRSTARPGAGTVHHVAFRVPDEETQEQWRERFTDIGLAVTPVKDRQYFKSIYFREPGGVLFEIATDPPGFTRDESVDDLASQLKLPPWLEDEREMLEAQLPPIETAGGAD